MSYLLDTNTISELVKKNPTKRVLDWFKVIPNESLYLSVLTLGEIRKGIETLSESARKESLRVWLENTLPDWFEDRILVFNKEVADRWGRLVGKMKNPVSAIDSQIAATALHYDLRLVTRNKKDFPYPELEVVCPWDEK